MSEIVTSREVEENALWDAEWSKLSSEFTNVRVSSRVLFNLSFANDPLKAGYREGITAGKEAFLQSGFDSGFAEVGVPIGRELGHLRGIAAALLAFLSSDATEHAHLMQQVREIDARLLAVHFRDIAPRDEEAERHAREHGLDDRDLGLDESMVGQNDVEDLVDGLARMNTGSRTVTLQKPTMEDIMRLKDALGGICIQVGLGLIP